MKVMMKEKVDLAYDPTILPRIMLLKDCACILQGCLHMHVCCCPIVNREKTELH